MRPAKRWAGNARLSMAIGAPIVINLLLFAGLLSALSSEQAGRYFAWMAVGSPAAVIAWLYLRRPRAEKL